MTDKQVDAGERLGQLIREAMAAARDAGLYLDVKISPRPKNKKPRAASAITRECDQ